MRMWAAGALILSTLIAGCLSTLNSGSDVGIFDGEEQDLQTQKYVEAYLEFSGPADKWAASSSFLMHIQARDKGAAIIQVVPALFKQRLETQEPARRLASTKSPELKGEEARIRLNDLALALDSPEQPFEGCLSPVRVRLVRVDGSLIEKLGCRSDQGWPAAVSAAVNGFAPFVTGAR